MPAYADANPEQPLPPPEGQRFRGFRTEFGRAVAGGGAGSFAAALGKYARVATGGASIGPRRFGPAYSAGGALVDLIGKLSSEGTAEIDGTDLSVLIGQPLEQVAEQIAELLAPDNADHDLIRSAILDAIVEALPDVEFFEPAALSPDQIISLLVEFHAQLLFREITNDAGEAWNKAEAPERTIEAETEFLDLIRASVDKHLSPVLAEGLGKASREEIEAMQRRAVDAIWAEWSTQE
ncbi:hypothetical protein [Caulobacter sp. Root487D2Y]|uniref:hypothetical protein n=1 Tax=Caulobacter sp. Root487D2Y TaxID=1736547 RepID=UPI001910FE64|nr:hypothetical protein [Caulobacter sp. Root487D2Y]